MIKQLCHFEGFYTSTKQPSVILRHLVWSQRFIYCTAKSALCDISSDEYRAFAPRASWAEKWRIWSIFSASDVFV